MGEEIASANPMPFEGFRPFRDDFTGARSGSGTPMFKFYQNLRLRRNRAVLRSRQINVIYTSCENRVIEFLRTNSTDYFLVVASLNNQAFLSGYWIPTDQLGSANWHEAFNSDAALYGGPNFGNFGATISSSWSGINVVIPANGFLVFERL
jgi:1,4-alpha-glucan branching enzyme